MCRGERRRDLVRFETECSEGRKEKSGIGKRAGENRRARRTVV